MNIRVLVLLLSLLTVKVLGAVGNESVIAVDSNEMGRMNKTLSLALKAGSVTGGISGSGIDVGYYLSPDFIIGGEYLKGETDLKDSFSERIFSTIDKSKVNAQVYGLYGRYFAGSTFAINSGIYYRNIESEIDVSSRYDKSYFISTKSQGSATVAKLGIGNYWSWSSGISLGCEWIGVQAPIANRNHKTTFLAGNGVTKSEKQSSFKLIDDLSQTFSSLTTWNVLTVHLGMSF